MKKYIFIRDDGGFGFKDDEINEILPTDVPIPDDIYNKFFELQSIGKQLKLKNIQAETFDEIFEEIPKTIIENTQQDEIQQIKQELLNIKQSLNIL